MRTALMVAAMATMALAAPNALAQDPGTGTTTTTPPAGAAGTVSAGATVDTTATAPAATTAPAVTATATAPAGGTATAHVVDHPAGDEISDHEKVVGKFAVGYMGMTQLPIGNSLTGVGTAPALTRNTIDTPVIGVRYWLKERIGLDIGLGFGLASGSTTRTVGNNENSQSEPAGLGFAIHGGVPLVLAHQKHYKFLVVPELNFGLTTRTVRSNATNPPPDISYGGYRLDIGARAGAEIHFGFIGVPQLALQATIGLNFRRNVWTASQDAGPNGPPQSNDVSVSSNALGTTVQSDPWALFTNNISALYYFP